MSYEHVDQCLYLSLTLCSSKIFTLTAYVTCMSSAYTRFYHGKKHLKTKHNSKTVSRCYEISVCDLHLLHTKNANKRLSPSQESCIGTCWGFPCPNSDRIGRSLWHHRVCVINFQLEDHSQSAIDYFVCSARTPQITAYEH